MLTLDNLTYTINNRTLLHPLTQKMKEGNIYGIIGPNGSGKTTLLKVIAQLWPASSGDVLWNGVRLNELDRRELSKLISLFSQSNTMPFNYLVWEIVQMGRYPFGTSQKVDEQFITSALKQVDAWHLRNRRIGELSHGERQRVFLARTLAKQSPIVLLDEPSSNLDCRHQWEMWKLIQKIAADGVIILIATHDLVGAKEHCNEIVVLNGGHCLFSGPSKEVLTKEMISSVFGITTFYQDF